MRRFDRSILIERLERLPEAHRVAFAASAAGRLFPAYVRYCQVAKQGDPAALRTVLQLAWDVSLGATESNAKLVDCEAIAHALTRIPETPPVSANLGGSAEDATAAVAYCLRTILRHDAKQAALAASRSYDAAYQAAVNNDTIGLAIVTMDDVERWLAHPLVQVELERQERDLLALESAVPEHTTAVVASMRERSSMEVVIPLETL
jgi:uncharacterized protein YjaG (DUF416 family)